MLRFTRHWPALIAAGATFAVRPAAAAPCADLTNPVYGAGGSAFTPTFADVAPVLLRANPPLTLVYQDPSACDGYGRFGDSPQPVLTGTARFWDASGAEQSCEITSAENIKAQFSTMGNSIALCPGRTLAADIRDFEGPVQTVNVVVHKDSTQNSISSEALYHIFGLANPGQVGPWGDRRYLVKRRAGSFVHAFVAQAAGLPVESFLGDTEVTTNQSTLLKVAEIGNSSATAREGALGYVSGPNAEAGTDLVRTLAYQHTGQACGYWPNSTESSRDKANVRNGQYYLWASNHFFARVDGTGQITDARVRQLFAFLTGSDTSDLAREVNAALIAGANVPQCAMRVKRDGDLGALSSWAPPVPCGCYFEKEATGSTTCTECASDTNCSGANPRCRGGFCEAY